MFLPRCLRSLSSSSSAVAVAAPSPPSHDLHPDHAVAAPVTASSHQQRVAGPGEPTCVICGRYGAYICDQTDEDVCSLECKAAVIERASAEPANFSLPRTGIFLEDECIYVKDGQQKLPEWEPDFSFLEVTNQQSESLRKEIGVHVKGDDAPAPILEFAHCGFASKIQSNLEQTGFDFPTPVQMQAIPAALKGRDILVSADTGSGKTAAFLLPIIARCSLIRSQYVPEREKPLAIVLTPTRELCAQVEEQAKAFGKGLPFKTALVVGGDALPVQLYRIKQGVELIVGTPGRLIDLLTKHPIDLDDVCMLILDEVDCMLDRGFRDQVMQIIRALSQPQIMMFSATIPPYTEKFALSILKRPLIVSVGKPNLPSGAVKQTVIWVESNRKKQKLFEILQSAIHFQPPVVVFVSSKAGADLLAEAICHVTGLKAAALHSDKQMKERRQVLSSFLMGNLPVIVATGVLGRGLYLIRVRQVVVFDMPNSLQEYIHQIGRASRLGVPGTAMVFINNESKALFKDFINLLQSSGAIVPRELANSAYAHSSYAVAYNHKKRKAIS